MTNPFSAKTPDELDAIVREMSDDRLEAAAIIAKDLALDPDDQMTAHIRPVIELERFRRRKSWKHRAKGWAFFLLQWVLLPIVLAVVGAFLAKLLGLA